MADGSEIAGRFAAVGQSLTIWWHSLSLVEQFLHGGSIAMFLVVAVLLWTPLGNRSNVLKCLVIAVGLHLVAYGYVDHFDLAPTVQPIVVQEVRAPLEMIRRPEKRDTAKLVDDPRNSAAAELSKPDPKRPVVEPEPVERRPIEDRAATIERPAPAPLATPEPRKIERIEPKASAAIEPPAPAPLERAQLADPTPMPKRAPVAVPAPPVEAQTRLAAPAATAPERTNIPRPTATTPDIPVARPTPRGDLPIVHRRSERLQPVEGLPSVTPLREGPLVSAPTPAIAAPTAPAVQSQIAAALPGPPIPSLAPPGRSDDMAPRRKTGSAGAFADASKIGLDALPITRREGTGMIPDLERRSAAPAIGGLADARGLLPTNRPSLPNASAPIGDPFTGVWKYRTAPDRLDVVFRHGGSDRTEQAVADALVWLAAHQSPGGYWDGDGYFHLCPPNDACQGAAIEVGSDTGLTGLALLAFLGAGHTQTSSSQHATTVLRGLQWLISQQGADGDLRGENGRVYSQAMATLAITEAYAMTKDDRLRAPAQRAIDWLVWAQHRETGGWRYGPQQIGDMSVHGWVVLAMRSAKGGGLNVPDHAWSQAQKWLALVTLGPSGGLAAYQPGGAPSHAMTAEALVCKQIFGVRREDPLMNEGGDYLIARLPDINDYHIYYWYYGTMAMFQLGGNYWTRWNDRLVATLLGSQRRTGHAKGSWDPDRPFGIDGGRVFTTAASALCLEVYYRYLPLYGERAAAVK